jgi:hypothetical protein
LLFSLLLFLFCELSVSCRDGILSNFHLCSLIFLFPIKLFYLFISVSFIFLIVFRIIIQLKFSSFGKVLQLFELFGHFGELTLGSWMIDAGELTNLGLFIAGNC